MLNKLKKWFKSFKSNIRYNYGFLKVLNSPFKPLKLSWYFGKITQGTPYFLPRKTVKMTKEKAIEYANADLNHKYYPSKKSFDELVASHMRSQMFVPIKYFNFHFTSLGWKTKWTADDYRFEWNPCISIVLFGKQLFIGIVPNVGKDTLRYDTYWESWLKYEHCTNKSLSKLERLKELISKYSCTWVHYEDKVEIRVNYYQFILKEKYLAQIDIESTIREINGSTNEF